MVMEVADRSARAAHEARVAESYAMQVGAAIASYMHTLWANAADTQISRVRDTTFSPSIHSLTERRCFPTWTPTTPTCSRGWTRAWCAASLTFATRRFDHSARNVKILWAICQVVLSLMHSSVDTMSLNVFQGGGIVLDSRMTSGTSMSRKKRRNRTAKPTPSSTQATATAKAPQEPKQVVQC